MLLLRILSWSYFNLFIQFYFIAIYGLKISNCITTVMTRQAEAQYSHSDSNTYSYTLAETLSCSLFQTKWEGNANGYELRLFLTVIVVSWELVLIVINNTTILIQHFFSLLKQFHYNNFNSQMAAPSNWVSRFIVIVWCETADIKLLWLDS